MKKNFKKLSSLALASALSAALSLSAFAAVSADQAKAIALKDAGLKESQVSYLVSRADYDDGVKLYEVSFLYVNEDGSYVEYDYDVKASDGKILEKDVDRERGKAGASAVKADKKAKQENKAQVNQGAEISAQEAKNVALAHFGLNAQDVKFYELHKEYDDGVWVYNVEFCKPYSEKYSCEVVVAGAAVRDAEREAVRGLGDKVELFFAVLFYNLFNK